jgi:hypothetical protein
MNDLLTELERMTTRMQMLEVEIASRAQGLAAVELLRTIPGCGYYMALALSCRIGDVKRFPRGKSLAHYWGLTPSVDDSGEGKGRRGRITKTGSAMARWLLAQVVLHVLRRDPIMRQWYKPICARRGSRIARVAVMRRMAFIIRNMLVEGQSYTVCRDAMIARRRSQLKSAAAAAAAGATDTTKTTTKSKTTTKAKANTKTKVAQRSESSVQ